MKQPEILAIGEVLVDFIPNEISKIDKLKTFHRFPGGAPANFIVGLSKLGAPCGFIGKVGKDPFGDFLVNFLQSKKVDTKYLLKSKREERTALAFVYYNEDLERNFFFYRKNAADTNLEPEEINEEYFKKVKYLHFGSVSLTVEPVRSATFKALELCKKNNGKISFDPNIREDLWENKKLLQKNMKKALRYTDIFLPSDKELKFLFLKKKIDDEEEMINSIFNEYPIKIIVVKKGKNGCIIKHRDNFLSTIPSFDVEVKDTTGAGDGFNSGFIYGLWKKLSVEEAGIIGNAVGALVVSQKGAMNSLPTKNQLIKFLKNNKVEIALD